MTDDQKARIEKMRLNGTDYASIASAIGATDAAVRMYCIRHDIKPRSEKTAYCLFCGNPIKRKARGRKALFCSDSCRVRQFTMEKRTDGPVKVCPGCGKQFRPDVRTRKYCSHECYVRARFRGSGNEA